jgi:Asp-tRNA(Asn)/Glu-tRNA(Gln) amidotransferase A subunit family amidase
MDVVDYMKHDATALAESVRSGEVTAAELLKLARERAAKVNPALNAIIRPMDKIADERAAGPLSGDFAGVPFLLKDLGQEYEGVPTTYGSRSLKDYVAEEHAEVVRRWLEAGLVVFGKTNAPEFGAKGITEPELFGATRNPWNTKFTPGGSSGGSAAAVAAGIVPAAGANDGGGSIRIPAGCCGLVGLKPGRGLTPYGPTFSEPLHGMAVQGVVSRTVRDSAGLLDVIVGLEATGTYVSATPPQKYVEQIKTPPGKLRIGFSAKSAINASPDPEAIAAMENAAALLTELGHNVEEIDPPYDDEALARDFLTLWFAEVAFEVAVAKKFTGAKNKDFEADTLAVAELGRVGGVVKAAEALEMRNEYARSIATFHESYDYFLTPTLAKPPLKVGEITTPKPLQIVSRVIARIHGGRILEKASLLDQIVEENLGWVPYTQLANVTGRPALSMPLHWTKQDGLPLGVQFVGTLGSEGALLQLAAQLEEAQPWFERYASL